MQQKGLQNLLMKRKQKLVSQLQILPYLHKVSTVNLIFLVTLLHVACFARNATTTTTLQ